MNAVPGLTTVPRPPMLTASEEAQRRGLLAMVHIAKKDLGLEDGEYEMILHGFKVASSGELSIPALERLVKYFKRLGWTPVRSIRKKRPADADARLVALRERCVEVAKSIDNGDKRLAGLAAKICGVATLTWCRDAAKLERLLAVLGKIKEQEGQKEERS